MTYLFEHFFVASPSPIILKGLQVKAQDEATRNPVFNGLINMRAESPKCIVHYLSPFLNRHLSQGFTSLHPVLLPHGALLLYPGKMQMEHLTSFSIS